VREKIAGNPLWYHTMELTPGMVTPGWFDLRPVVGKLPWPDVSGRRCLDIGTYDGFYAFELERRGAAEVIAVDIPDHNSWDWPPDVRARGGQELARLAGPEKGLGFRIARELLGSSVEWRPVSVYDLAATELGTFDVIVCGSLLLHLRDPLRALDAVRGVCRGVLLSMEQIDLKLTALLRRVPVAQLDGMGSVCQWWTPNAAGHRRMLMAAGFSIERSTRPFVVPFGPAHPPVGTSLRSRAELWFRRAAAGGTGVPHAAVLARPAV